jgi:carbon monoxide dehydrogenase subunit G
MAIGPFRAERPRPLTRDESRHVERRVYVKAPPRAVWAALHDASSVGRLFPELRLGPAGPAWPAAATVRYGRARLGLLRDETTVESLEARPLTSFRLRVTGRAFASEWRWRLEPLAGGTRVVHEAVLEPSGRITGWLIRLGRDSLGERVEAHLRALKEVAESTSGEDMERGREARLA